MINNNNNYYYDQCYHYYYYLYYKSNYYYNCLSTFFDFSSDTSLPANRILKEDDFALLFPACGSGLFFGQLIFVSLALLFVLFDCVVVFDPPRSFHQEKVTFSLFFSFLSAPSSSPPQTIQTHYTFLLFSSSLSLISQRRNRERREKEKCAVEARKRIDSWCAKTYEFLSVDTTFSSSSSSTATL